jgi:hypothetical protein
MNFFYYYIKIIKEYFSNKYFLIISICTVFFIYFLHKILFILMNFENFSLLYWHFIAPFFIYTSMIFFVTFYYYHKISKSKSFLSLFFTILLKGLVIIIIKLIWNFFKVILIESNIVVVKEDSHLYPLFLLGFTWYIIYSASQYFIHSSLSKHKKKLKSFFYYSIDNFWFILFNLLFAFIFSFIIIILSSFMLSKIQNIFSFLLTNNTHIFIENILSISFNIFFSHITALLFVYKSTNKKIK